MFCRSVDSHSPQFTSSHGQNAVDSQGAAEWVSKKSANGNLKTITLQQETTLVSHWMSDRMYKNDSDDWSSRLSLTGLKIHPHPTPLSPLYLNSPLPPNNVNRNLAIFGHSAQGVHMARTQIQQCFRREELCVCVWGGAGGRGAELYFRPVCEVFSPSL